MGNVLKKTKQALKPTRTLSINKYIPVHNLNLLKRNIFLRILKTE